MIGPKTIFKKKIKNSEYLHLNRETSVLTEKKIKR